MNILFKLFIWIDKILLFWGPGVHLHLGNKIIKSNNKDIEDIELIQRNYKYFLYGSVSPDITLGKKYIKDLEKHSHKWETGFMILKESKNDKQKALAYGYLSHLAADIVAHNYFLPKELLVARGFRSFMHTVLEMKVDITIYKDTFESIEAILEDKFDEEDKFLQSIISKALLPFGVNRKIFEYTLKASKSQYLYKAFRKFGKFENWKKDNEHLIKEYHDLSYNLILDILSKNEESTVINYDPNGYANFEMVNELKKEFKKSKHKDKNHFYKIPDDLKI